MKLHGICFTDKSQSLGVERQGAFHTNLANMRVTYNFSPSVFVQSLLQYNDRTETQAIKIALGDEHAHRVRISSTKSMTGHLAAGAGGVEAVASVLAIAHQCVPPTINYVTPDPDCDLDVTPNKAIAAKLRVVLSNSFGLGGQNAAAIFRVYE